MARKDIPDKLVCKAYEDAASERRRGVMVWPEHLLAEWTGQPEKVCFAAMDRADDRGYIDFGVSLRSGWLTDKGKELLHGSATQITT